MYQVLARKWRPQSFDELVGQRHVTRTLANALEGDRLAHAYIFAGVRGTGKTTVARILAKCLNCEKGPTTKPCGKCPPCVEIAESRAIDVLEIDAASRTKVEQTRELLEVVSYAPARDRYKILIIDEAHMLSKASFNALLKTLEEPPPNVLFLLATTEIQKILPTILSRCQVFDFQRVAPKEVAEHLGKICATEKIEISAAALDRVARAGEGSVRDALSVLERVLAFCGQSVSDDDVMRVLGAVRAEVLTDMLGHLARRDAAGMLSVLDSLVAEGHDLLHFWQELIAALRDLMFVITVPDRPELLGRSEEEARTLSAAAEGLGREDLVRCFQILADLEPALKSSAQPRFMFESALIRLASLGAVRPIEELLAGAGPVAAPPRPARRPPAQKKSPAAAAPEPPPAAKAPAAPAPAASGDLKSQLIAALHRDEPMMAAMLEQSGEVRIDDDGLQIEFPPGSEALLGHLQRKESAAKLKTIAESVAGQPLQVRLETGGSAPPRKPAQATEARPTGAAESADQDAVEDTPPGASPLPPSERGPSPELMDQARKEPGVQRLLREFGAQVVDIRPLGEAPVPGPAPERPPQEDS